jgi:hypothetical protein
MANVGNTVDPSPSRASDALRGLGQTVVDDPTLSGTPRPMSTAGRPGTGGRALGRLADGTPYFAALGELPYDPDEDRVQCHPLREWFRQVAGHHLLKRHGWTVEQYRREFRLAQSVSTCAPGLTAIKSRVVADQNAFRAPGRFTDNQAAARHAASRSSRAFPRVIKSLADGRPDLVAEFHLTRNAGLSPAAIAMTSTEPVWWRCSTCGQEWQASIDARRRTNRGHCPRCRRERQRHNPRLREINAHLQQARAAANPLGAKPQLLAEWRPTRNVGLDPTTLARGSHRRAWWLCGGCGHEWQTLSIRAPTPAPAARAAHATG